MRRPCFIVIDREFAGNISTRKLVIETAKFNVITAYSSQEALETLVRFPDVDGAVIDAGVADITCDHLIQELKAIKPTLPIVAITGLRMPACPSADHQLETFEPAPLLEVLRAMEKAACDEIERREEQLHVEGK